MQTYTIDVTADEIDHLLAEMNIARFEEVADGFDGSARANERLAANLIRQVLAQGFEGGDALRYGGKIVEAHE